MSWNLHIHCLLAVSLALSTAVEAAFDQSEAGLGSRAAALVSFEGGQPR